MASGDKSPMERAILDEVRALREAKRLDIPELANRSGLPEVWVREALRDNRTLTLDHIDALCVGLEVSLADLIRAADKRLGHTRP